MATDIRFLDEMIRTLMRKKLYVEKAYRDGNFRYYDWLAEDEFADIWQEVKLLQERLLSVKQPVTSSELAQRLLQTVQLKFELEQAKADADSRRVASHLLAIGQSIEIPGTDKALATIAVETTQNLANIISSEVCSKPPLFMESAKENDLHASLNSAVTVHDLEDIHSCIELEDDGIDEPEEYMRPKSQSTSTTASSTSSIIPSIALLDSVPMIQATPPHSVMDLYGHSRPSSASKSRDQSPVHTPVRSNQHTSPLHTASSRGSMVLNTINDPDVEKALAAREDVSQAKKTLKNASPTEKKRSPGRPNQRQNSNTSLDKTVQAILDELRPGEYVVTSASGPQGTGYSLTQKLQVKTKATVSKETIWVRGLGSNVLVRQGTSYTEISDWVKSQKRVRASPGPKRPPRSPTRT
ncbi:hypothetical protein CANCADRAFT_46145 [Tortispora caseinolytica NRRL Y-17796]|uniref:Uncharacterized protein n=1 Tax=Tortispora caseinolytica NRRL Y-17796 TaxID=767744 RepID=A0A1E4TDA4_9ASCO|nr:hypothetical protein CANCADRAFT_46145 [Tortispora caseinolytica NRRL Y-17796]